MLRVDAPPSGAPLRPADDSAVTIQAALDAAFQAGGGVVELAPGLYPLHRALRIPSRVTLRGAGRGRTTLRLVEIGTQLPDNPAGCPPGTPPPQRLASALLNAGHNHLLLQRRYVPATRTCVEPRVDRPHPRDRDISVTGLTLDCNSRALYPGGPQSSGSGNLGCASFDNLDGLRIEDVAIVDANVDGLLLGLYDGLLDFRVRRLRVEGAGRFGIGWIAAARGLLEDSELVANLAGGIDLEPVASFGPGGVAHDVTVRDLRVSGAGASAALTARAIPFGRDMGIILCFSDRGLTHDLRFERILVEDVRGLGVSLLWRGDYRDVTFDLDLRRTGVGGLYSNLGGRGRAVVRGRMEEVGSQYGASGAAVGLFGAEQGWTIGPLDVKQGPAWGNGAAIMFTPGARDHELRDVAITVTCDPRDTGCQRSIVAAPRHGPLDPSIRVTRSAVHHAPPPPAASLPSTEKRD